MARAVSAEVEFVIVGQGLAGTALAWELLWRGLDVLVVDAGEEVTSSKIAAGLFTPITGQRMALSWRVAEMLAAAEPFYERVAGELGREVFHRRPVRRIFQRAEEAALWEKRRHEPARQPFIARAEVPEAGLHGGFELHGGYLDCAGYVAASRAEFARRGVFREARLEAAEAADLPARTVVFCQGYVAAGNPLFPWIKWKAAKGEILTLRAPAADPSRILSAGQWLVTHPDGTARTGSTYEWTQLDRVPTAAARAKLEAGLARLVTGPWDVTAHRAAVRPIISESKALIGRHPVREKLAFFNGLGSKGSLHAPFFAAQLAAHLIDGAPLDPACDLQRNG